MTPAAVPLVIPSMASAVPMAPVPAIDLGVAVSDAPVLALRLDNLIDGANPISDSDDAIERWMTPALPKIPVSPVVKGSRKSRKS